MGKVRPSTGLERADRWVDRLEARLSALERRSNSIAPRRARVFRSTNQGIANVTQTAISFSTERYDLGGFWVVGNPTRLTIPDDGVYTTGGAVIFDTNATGVLRQIGVRVDGTTFIVTQAGDSTGTFGDARSVATEYEFTAGQYVELVVVHDAGVGINVLASPDISPEFWISRKGA